MSDAELMRDFYAGGEDAFVTLVGRYTHSLIGRARVVVGSAEAEDVAQQVWLKIWMTRQGNASKFDPSKGSFSSWVNRIAFNTSISARRKQRYFRLPNGGHDIKDSSDPVDGYFATLERWRLLVATELAKMPFRLQTVAHQKLTGKTNQTIADTLGLSKGAITARVRTITKKLKTQIPEAECV